MPQRPRPHDSHDSAGNVSDGTPSLDSVVARLDGLQGQLDLARNRDGARLARIERDLSQVIEVFRQAGTLPEAVRDDDLGLRSWGCASCGRRVGVHDPTRSEIRVRLKQQVVCVVLGPGGSMSVSCQFCGAANLLSSSPGAVLAPLALAGQPIPG